MSRQGILAGVSDSKKPELYYWDIYYIAKISQTNFPSEWLCASDHIFESREGLIIKCPLNDLFHDVVTIILTSRMGVSEMVVNVGNIVTVI